MLLHSVLIYYFIILGGGGGGGRKRNGVEGFWCLKGNNFFRLVFIFFPWCLLAFL